MNSLIIATGVEAKKALKSRMLLGTLIFYFFIAFMLGLLMLIARHPELAGGSAILSTKASFISRADWAGFFAMMLQMALVLGLLGPSIVTVWVFGREYSDRTIKDLLSLPVSRENIVMAKFIVSFIWSLALMAILLAGALIAGHIVRLENWHTEIAVKNISGFCISSLLTILLFPVISLITSVSKGYLLPVGITFLILMGTQFLFMGMPSLTPLFPWAIPGLFSGVAGPLAPKPGLLSLVILLFTSLAGIAGTIFWWRYADHH
jgi:ABC-2 type transport system permease protein